MTAVLPPLEVDREAARHLRRALNEHVRQYATVVPIPPLIVELRAFADAVVHGEAQTKPDTFRGGRDTGLRDGLPPFLTQAAYARLVGVSPRTVSRWLRTGKIARHVAGIPREEVDRPVNRRTAA